EVIEGAGVAVDGGSRGCQAGVIVDHLPRNLVPDGSDVIGQRPVAGGEWWVVGLCLPELCPGALSPGAKRGGKGPAARRVGGGPKGRANSHLLPPPSRLRKLRRQGPAPTSWGTKSIALSPGAKRGGKGPPRSGVGGGPKGRANPSPTLPP